MLKRLLLAVALVVATASIAAAEIRVQHGYGGGVHVNGYYRSSGTYVQPHHRSYPDGNFYNNWSTYGNVNPYTGAYGTRQYPSYPSYGGYGGGGGYFIPGRAYGAW